MWHEARQQEKKIREVMVDFQKRAERRREHYEKMRGDPNQLLRLAGNKCRMHLDPTGGVLDSSMIPWQGQEDNLISRYDVRMHLDVIPDYSNLPEHEMSREEKEEQIKCNYERYRALIKNTFEGVSEADALAKIDADEMFPVVSVSAKKNKEKQKLAKSKVAISYTYDDSTVSTPLRPAKSKFAKHEEEEDESSDDEYEMDIDVDRMDTRKINILNVIALDYGVSSCYFSKALRSEKLALLEKKEVKLAEAEKSAFCGKKARRERRLLKELLSKERRSPPSYARRSSPTYEPYEAEEVSERPGYNSNSSSSDEFDGEMTFITEFGGEERETQPIGSSRPLTDQGSSHSVERHRGERMSDYSRQRSSHSRRRSRSRSRERSHRYRSRSRSRDRSRRYNRSRSRERHHSRHHSPPHRRRSRTKSRSRSISPKRTPSRKQDQESKNSSATNVAKLLSSAPSASKKSTEKIKLTPQERLKKKMQAMLNKTYKQEKKTEREKAVARESERLEREEELREEIRKKREREWVRRDRETDGSYYRSRSPSPADCRHW